MIRHCTTKDRTSIAVYLATKLKISLSEANSKAKRIVKNGMSSFLKEEKNLTGLCWVETRIVNDKKEKFVEILSDHWKLAESFLQCLRWALNGDYYFAAPIHDSLNRTFNKHGLQFIKVNDKFNVYIGRFEKRVFKSFKSEDIDAD